MMQFLGENKKAFIGCMLLKMDVEWTYRFYVEWNYRSHFMMKFLGENKKSIKRFHALYV